MTAVVNPKLIVVMQPGEVATYLEAVQAALAGLEQLPPDEQEHRLAQVRDWLAASAHQLRSADPRGKPATAQPRATQGAKPGVAKPSTGPELRAATAPVKKPCDCEKAQRDVSGFRRALEEETTGKIDGDPLGSISWRAIGEAVARRLFG